MCHWTKTQDSGLRVTQTGNVSQDTDTGQWKWDRNDRKCVTGHRAVEMRQEWQERCHRTQTHGSGDETGMSGDWQERCHRTHRAVEMKLTQTGMTRTVSQDTDTGQCRKDDRNDWRWDRQEWWDKTDRQEWLEMRQTGMMSRDWQTGMTEDETDRNDETRLTDRNDWRRDRLTDRNDSSIWLGYLLFHLLLQKTSLKSLWNEAASVLPEGRNVRSSVDISRKGNGHQMLDFSTSLTNAGNSGCLTWVRHSSPKSSATHSYLCVQHFPVSKQRYGCQRLGFVTCAQMLMHATAHGAVWTM